MRKRIAGIAVLVLLVGACIAAGDEVILSSVKDNTLYESPTGGLSNGVGEFTFTGRVGPFNAGVIRRAVLAFDVTAEIPAGATIDSVVLALQMSKTKAATVTNDLYKVLADWGEGTSDAPAEEGGGVRSTTGDATWIHTFHNTGFWTTPGGDYAVGSSATTGVGDVGSYTWGSTSQMVADVQDWLDTPADNFGWILIGDEGGPGTAKRFNSRENVTLPPTLTVQYTPIPEPGTMVLLGIGALAVMRRRMRK